MDEEWITRERIGGEKRQWKKNDEGTREKEEVKRRKRRE